MEVITRKEDDIFYIVLNRPNARNSVNKKTANLLAAAFQFRFSYFYSLKHLIHDLEGNMKITMQNVQFSMERGIHFVLGLT